MVLVSERDYEFAGPEAFTHVLMDGRHARILRRGEDRVTVSLHDGLRLKLRESMVSELPTPKPPCTCLGCEVLVNYVPRIGKARDE